MKPKSAKVPRGSSSAGKRRVPIGFSHVVLFVAGMVLMALLHYLFFPGSGSVWKLADGKGAVEKKQRDPSKPVPPWGDLEYTPIALDRPEAHFTNMVQNVAKSRWVLHRAAEPEMAELFNSLQLAEPARSFLLDRNHWRPIADGYEIMPPPDVVISLPPDARQKLYTELARDPENIPQTMPFTFRTEGFEEWFSECGLPKEKVDLVRKLCYTNNQNLSFADANVFREVSTEGETMCLLKGLWRVPTFMLKVRITPNTDVDGLMNYWGKAGPAHSYRPLVESMTRVPEGASINISYFLPPFASLRLFTYPQPDDQKALQEDCFWSAMNFFNEKPDDRLFDPTYKDEQLRTQYAKVAESERQFGDLLMLMGGGKTALHMCVYLADDVVFTKNGANAVQPWVLMKITEMLGIYERLRPYQIVYYRRKNLNLPTTGSLFSRTVPTNTLALTPALALNLPLRLKQQALGKPD